MTKEPRVYIVDDDTDLLSAIVEIIESVGIPARGFVRAKDMLEGLDPEWDGMILSDMRMPDISGLELLIKARAMAPDVPVVLFTAHGDIRSAVQAIQDGAFDFLEKPAPPEVLIAVIKRAMEHRRLTLENQRLRERIARGTDLRARLIGRSVAMRDCRRELAAIAPLNIDVLLCGEPGTGKQLAARVLHDFSGLDGEFIEVNCNALTEGNFDSIIVGDDDHPGAISAAAGGTLYMDRVGGLSPGLQSRLLAVIEAHRNKFRLIISAHGTLAQLRSTQTLSDDLNYRLGLTEIELPALRDREDDVYLLLAQFLREAASRHERRFPELTKQELLPYRNYHWPGNLRELRNVAEKLVIGLKVTLHISEARSTLGAIDELEYEAAMVEFESSLLRAALQRTGGRKTEAAVLLGIPRKRLYLRMKACGVEDAGQN